MPCFGNEAKVSLSINFGAISHWEVAIGVVTISRRHNAIVQCVHSPSIHLFIFSPSKITKAFLQSFHTINIISSLLKPLCPPICQMLPTVHCCFPEIKGKSALKE